MELHLYNTLSRKKEKFSPLKKTQVSMYSCGPTVYWYQHIGNMRTYLFVDALKRTLQYNDYKVKHVMNITDVGHLTSDADEGEDKMETAVKREGKSAEDIAQHYTNAFLEDLTRLNILPPTLLPRATEHIPEQIELIKVLEDKEYTYRTADGIYFDSSLFKNYSKLARLHVKGLQQGKRVAAGEKHHKTDFALWKFSNTPGVRQQEWPSPWGIGYPGWHIECSAMAMHYLGQEIDIHTGGEDHIPVHHTNEIAQSEAATGKKFVNYWLHGAFLLSKGEKVSKSKGGLYTISDLEKMSYLPAHYRYLCLLTHYRKPLNFTLEHLESAKVAYERLKRKIQDLKEHPAKGKDVTKKYEKEFHEAVNNDLNFPEAIQVLWKLVDSNSKNIREAVKKMDEVLGLELLQEIETLIPQSVQELITERDKAREAKNWKLSDELRHKIRAEGYEVEDSSSGQKITKK